MANTLIEKQFQAMQKIEAKKPHSEETKVVLKKFREKIQKEEATCKEDWFIKATICFAEENLDEAKKNITKALSLDENYIEAYKLLVSLHIREKEYEQAKQCLLKLVALNPKDKVALDDLGNIWEELGELDKAIECFETLIDLDATFISAYNNAAVVLKKMGDYDEAIKKLLKGIELEEDELSTKKNKQLYYNLAQICLIKGLYEDALKYFDRAIIIDPCYVNALNDRGNLHVILGRIVDAELDFEEAYKYARGAEKLAIEGNKKRVLGERKISPAHLSQRKRQKLLEKIDLDPSDIITPGKCLELLRVVAANNTNFPASWKKIQSANKVNNKYYTGVCLKNDRNQFIVIHYINPKILEEISKFNKKQLLNLLVDIFKNQVQPFIDTIIHQNPKLECLHIGQLFGASMAEVCAEMRGDSAITFDSAGAKEIIDVLEHVNTAQENIVGYFSSNHNFETLFTPLGEKFILDTYSLSDNTSWLKKFFMRVTSQDKNKAHAYYPLRGFFASFDAKSGLPKEGVIQNNEVQLAGKLPSSETNLSFIEEEILGDGDCGFTSLKTDRAQLSQALLGLKNNIEDRDRLSVEIKEAFIAYSVTDGAEGVQPLNFEVWKILLESRDSAQTKLDQLFRKTRGNLVNAQAKTLNLLDLIKWLQKNNQSVEAQTLSDQYSYLQRKEKELKRYCKSLAAFEYYVDKLKTTKLWLGYKSAILYAKAKDMCVYIWKKNTNNVEQLDLIDSYESLVNSHNKVHLLHTNNFRHFNRLEISRNTVSKINLSRFSLVAQHTLRLYFTEPEKIQHYGFDENVMEGVSLKKNVLYIDGFLSGEEFKFYFEDKIKKENTRQSELIQLQTEQHLKSRTLAMVHSSQPQLLEIPSLITSSVKITYESWVVSLVHKPRGQNPDHAFILMEGITKDGIATLFRYDLVQDMTTKGKALINIRERINSSIAQRAENLRTILNYDQVRGFSWNISREKAKELHAEIHKDQQNPPHYQILGNKSLPAKSSSDEGHNCFTWPREKLNNLKVDSIKVEEKWVDLLGAKTTLYFKNKETVAGNSSLFKARGLN